MPRRRRKQDSIEAPDVAETPAVTNPIAHIVTKAQLATAKRGGDKIKSLCGEATIKGDAPTGAPICQKCVLAQLSVDDRKFGATGQERYDAGLAAGEQRGIAKGRADSMREIREAAEQRAASYKAAS